MSKMINCKSCNAEIATSAKSCPKCGAKNKKPIYKRVWFWVVVVFVLIPLLGSLGDDGTDADTQQASNDTTQTEQKETKKESKTAVDKALENAIEVDYKTLHKDYMDNAIGADSKYKGKMLILTGEIGEIDREIAGEPYVTFDIDEYFNNIRITFDKDEEEKIASLNKGQTIKVVGECQGTLLSTTVSLTDSLIVESK